MSAVVRDNIQRQSELRTQYKRERSEELAQRENVQTSIRSKAQDDANETFKANKMKQMIK